MAKDLAAAAVEPQDQAVDVALVAAVAMARPEATAAVMAAAATAAAMAAAATAAVVTVAAATVAAVAREGAVAAAGIQILAQDSPGSRTQAGKTMPRCPAHRLRTHCC